MAETTTNPLSGSAADDAAAAARSASNTIRAGGERALADAKTKMLDAAEAQRQRAVEAVRGMAGALHRAAGDLKMENESMGRYTDMAADRLDQFAGYLRGSTLSDVLEEAEGLARRQPAWCIGGAMAVGFLVARAIKNASPPSGRGRSADYGRRLAASSAVGSGTSTEAGVFPATTATTRPISSASGGSAPGGGEA
ncbi:MAG: hypothetical protein NVV74_14110 [Magnetospirillum sp.]|nr:hypothetical protein [Magnetospirillum sp.]